MPPFLIYEGKVAVVLLVFYLFYRFLLKQETFHRLNRIVLVGTAVLSFLLPLCIITIRKPVEMEPQVTAPSIGMAPELAPVVEKTATWWPLALAVLFWAGVAFVLVRVAVSVLSIIKLVRAGETVGEEEGCKIVVTDRDVVPFSWMRYIVLSRKDWEGDCASILAHEKAHVAYGHSVELLLVDVLSALQWFNPAVWMLRADLQELHEYEADDAVLRSGADLREYQYLLIRKAVGKSGYSVANSFNHSILKNRITMMSKSKSPLRRRLRVLYLLPLVCLGLGLQAKTVYVPTDKDNNNIVADAGDDVKKVVTIKIDSDERIYINVKEVQLHEIAKYIEALGAAQEISVKFEQEQDIPEEVMIEIRNQLRQAGVQSARYSAVPVVPLYILLEPDGGEKEMSREELETMDRDRILSVEIMEDEIAREKYGERAANGVVVLSMKQAAKDDGAMIAPRFLHGDINHFEVWVNEHIEYPREALDAGFEGRVIVQLDVCEDGEVREVKVVQSASELLDAEALRVVSASPRWEPAILHDKPVRVTFQIPVVFSRSTGDKQSER